MCHFGTYGLNSNQHHAMAYGVLWDPSTCALTLDSNWVPHRMLSLVSEPSGIYNLVDTFIFGSVLGMSNHLFWDPNFSPPCGQWGPHIFVSTRSPDLIKSLAHSPRTPTWSLVLS